MTYKEKLVEVKNLPEVKELLRFCRRNGCRVYFERSNCVNGEYFISANVIVVRFSNRTNIWSIVWVLAHEVRHLKHCLSNKYNNYYSTSPSFICGIRAEQDCNDWASEFLYLSRRFVYQRKYKSVNVSITD